ERGAASERAAAGPATRYRNDVEARQASRAATEESFGAGIATGHEAEQGRIALSAGVLAYRVQQPSIVSSSLLTAQSRPGAHDADIHAVTRICATGAELAVTHGYHGKGSLML